MGFNYICFAFFISLVFASEFCIGFKYDSSPHPWKLGGTVIGIDFGTTYSRAGVYNNGKVEIISNIPSFVAFTDTGVRLIGEAAKNQTALNPERTIFNVKRLLGRMFDDPEVQKDLKMLPYKVVNKDGEPYIEVKIRDGETTRTEVFSPEEISAMIIENIKEMAEYYLGKTIHNAVVTIPAYFNDAERQATHDAYALAGLNVVRIINEATAAAIAYGLHERAGDPKNILVIDLGGGTLDASVLNIDEGVIEFLSSSSSSSSQTIDDLFRRIVGPALKDANLEWSDVDEILVVGECTRIANVKEVLIRGGDYLGGKELLSNGSVNPDEAVAYGAAVQGWILSGLPYFVSTKLSLGIETAGGVMTTLIPIYTTMPTKMSQVFSTCKHNQTTLSIKIYDGERAFTRDCRQLGSFELSGIPPAPRGVPDIEVVFEMDENYILKVTAQDKELKSSITLDVRPRITKDKIQEKIRDAEEFAEEDRKAKEKIEARNNKLMTIKEMIDEQDTVVLDDGNHPIVKKKKKKKNKGGRRCCRPQSSDIAKDEL